MDRSMRYFVTGATGFLGSHVAEQLLDDGHEVVVLARTPSKASDLDAAGAEVVEGDITDKESMREPMDGADGVFHIAGWYKVGVRDPTPGERINVEGTRTVMELVDELGIEKAVYTSTVAVNSDTKGAVVDENYRYHGPHLTAYDRTKWEAHYEVVEPMVEDGLPVVTVMPGAIYGEGDTSQLGQLWRDYLQGDVPAIPRKSAYCWGHVEDTARAHLLAMEEGTPGEEYIVAGEPATLTEMFELAEEVTGVDAPRAVSPKLFRAMAPIAGLAERFVDLPDEYRSESLRVLGGVTYLGDNAKATEELGLEHRPLEEGFRELLEHELAALDDAEPDQPSTLAAPPST
jgi:nucleoside-diphosphate-sugar epimerase